MAAPSVPTDDALREFLLGALPAERAEEVRAWVDADPTNAVRLKRLAAGVPHAATLSDDRPPPADASSTPNSDGHATRIPAEGSSVSASSLAWPPATLGQFRIVRELGHGGMGYVFEAEDEKLGRRVAIKMLPPGLCLTPDVVARFLREARAAATVEHENVVPILHIGEHAGAPYIVMPLLKGESLYERLKREGKLSVAALIRIGRDVAAGLAAAHARGLIHRDLKPANVWLEASPEREEASPGRKSGEFRGKILDFGLARLSDCADGLTTPGALLGTPAYMAPEQIDGRTDARSDLFGLGATLYECAAGRRAFDGPTITAILNAVSQHNPPAPIDLNPEVPADLSALILRLLAKKPTDRPADAEAVVAALASCGIGDVSTETWLGRARPKPAPRRRWAWVAAAAVVLVLGSAGVWFATRPTTPAVNDNTPPVPIRFHGKVDVLVERTVGGVPRLLRLNEPDALPLKQTDKFRIEGEVDPPAYLYVVWVDPNHDITPVYPWDATKGWNSRPEEEKPLSKIGLPSNVGNRYTAPAAAPGVATMVLFARTTPLDVPDEEVRSWFEKLPDLPLPAGGEAAAVWFDDYLEVRDSSRRRTFGEVGSDDAFARWHGQLQKSLGDNAAFQTAVCFARTDRK